MNRAWIPVAGIAALVAGVYALSAQPVTTPGITGIAGAYNTGTVTCTNLQPCWLQTDINGQLKVSASVSSTVTGFPGTQTTGTPISVTTGGVTGTLPSGTEVVATNVGTTNAAYCKLGASATTSDQYISPNGGWFAFTVGAATQLTCITSTSTTTVNMVGGSGLPTGTGGGGGGSGGSVTQGTSPWVVGQGTAANLNATVVGTGTFATQSAITAAANSISDGADVTQGLKNDSVCGTATGNCTLIALIKYLNNAVNSSIPAGAAAIGTVGQTGMNYETVAASQTAQALGATGAAGDFLSHCVVYPTTTTPGVVTVFDGTSTTTNNVITFPGGASSISNLVPFTIPVGATSLNSGGWKATTGANLLLICYGRFT